MSNYLFVAGNTGPVEILLQHFESAHGANSNELSSTLISDKKMLFVIERRNESVKSSIVKSSNDDGLFFRGQALDHDSSSMILGVEGFAKFQKRYPSYSNPQRIADLEGTFVLARWNQDVLTFQNDLYSIYRMLYFASEDVLIVSDSLVVITECLKKLGIERKLNLDVATIKAWNASGLPNAPMTDELIVQGIFSLQVGKHIEMEWNSDKISVKQVERSVIEIFKSPLESYESIVRECVKRMYSSINFIVESFNPTIEFGLSGGIDSRLILAICLQSESIMKSMVINTNTSETRASDYNVVKSLSERYKFTFNNSERRKKLRNQSDSKRIKIGNTLGFWKLASLGVYDSFYLTPHHYEYPSTLHLSGVGAEPVKQAMDNSRIDKMARSQHPAIRDTVRKKLRETISKLGVDTNAADAMKWYHMTYKAAYHLGFKIAQSSMLLRPYAQKSIFTIALAEDNPFRGKENVGATVLHDMIILLNPELASLPYDLDSKNISYDYAVNRLSELGGKVHFDEMPKPSVFGQIEHIANGPPQAFLSLVKGFSWSEETSQREQLLEMVKHNYKEKILSNELKVIYQSCYENTVENLLDENKELASAGALAARFIAFDLFE